MLPKSNAPFFEVLPKVSVHPETINLYNEVVWSPYKPIQRKYEHLIKSDKRNHGKVSYQSRKKVSRAIEYLLFMANDKTLPDTAHGKQYKFRVAFVTLTLPSAQVHTDNEIKESCLNHFLVELRNRYKVRNYIWRAEKQKNGNIHFHILIDRFVPWSELRDRWNRIVNKLGYVDRYRDEMRQFHNGSFKVRSDLLKKWAYKEQVRAYQKGKANDWNSPNSTDIHSLYRINKVKGYLVKYCTKDSLDSEVLGRMWGSNYELSDIKGGTEYADNQLKDEIAFLSEKFPEDYYAGDYFTVLHIDIRKVIKFNCTALYKLFCQYMYDQFKFNVQEVFPEFTNN